MATNNLEIYSEASDAQKNAVQPVVLSGGYLRKILQNVSVGDLLNTETISRRWRQYTYWETFRRTSVMVLIGPKSKEDVVSSVFLIPDHDLVVRPLSDMELYAPTVVRQFLVNKDGLETDVLSVGKCQYLMIRCPCVNSLGFSMLIEEDQLNIVSNVLLADRYWSDHIVKLEMHLRLAEGIALEGQRIHGDEHSINPNVALINLLEQINRLASLQFLTLEIGTYIFGRGNPRGLSLDMPILHQLRKFEFFSQDEPLILVDSLRAYVPNNLWLEAIVIKSLPNAQHSFEEMHLLPRTITRLFRGIWPHHFRTCSIVEIMTVTTFCFDALTEFSISNLTGIKYSILVVYLLKLRKLLYLHMDFSQLSYQTMGLNDREKLDAMKPLRSVQILKLQARFPSCRLLVHMRLAEIFPNLKVITLENHTDICRMCYWNYDDFKYDEEDFEECRCKFTCPLKDCEHLEKVSVVYSRGQYTYTNLKLPMNEL